MPKIYLVSKSYFGLIKTRLLSNCYGLLFILLLLFLLIKCVSFGGSRTNKYDNELNPIQEENEDLIIQSILNEQRKLKAKRAMKFNANLDPHLEKAKEIPKVVEEEEKQPSIKEMFEGQKNLLQPIKELIKLKPHLCDEKLELYLETLRNTQNETLTYWHKLDVPSKFKWTSLASLYDPKLINFGSLFRFQSDGELKYFLDFNNHNESNCNVYTFGIGFDYGGEAKFKRRYPQCKMTAVDPEERINREQVEKVSNARFIKATIGAKDGTHSASIRQMNRKYKTVTVEHTGMTNFLQKYNGNKTIDMMILDIEGGEYEVLPALIEEKSKLPTICQINFEVHYPPENYGFSPEKALENVHKFFNDGTYTVFNFELFLQMMRIFVVNTSNKECLDKFFCMPQNDVVE